MLTPHFSLKNLFIYFICYNFDAMITYTTIESSMQNMQSQVEESYFWRVIYNIFMINKI